MKINKENIGRAYFYTKLGWGNYIAWWLGAIAYITIIYELILRHWVPFPYFAYPIIFILLMACAFTLGYLAARKKIYGVEHQINAETNPYKDRLLGQKEILSWEINYYGLIQGINLNKLWLKWWKKQGATQEQIEEIREALENQEKLLTDLKKMINRAVE